MPRVTHRSMWFRALATTRTCTSSGAEVGQLDRPPAVGARRLVEDPRVPCPSRVLAHARQRRRRWGLDTQHDDAASVGLDPDDEVAALPHVDAVEPHVLARRELPRPVRRRPRGDRRDAARSVPFGRRRRAFHRSATPIAPSTSTTSKRPSDGWPRGATSQARGARRSSRRRPGPPPRPAGDDVGDEPGWRPSSRAQPRSTSAENAASPRSRSGEPVPPSVRHRSPPSRPTGGIGAPARRRALTSSCSSASERTSTSPAGAGPVRPQASPLRTVIRLRVPHPLVPVARRSSCGAASVASSSSTTAVTVLDAATTPRNSRSAASAAARRVSACGATIGELAEQVDQLLHVAHEVAAGQLLRLDHLGEALTGRPGVGDGDERRVGRRGAGSAGLLLAAPTARRDARRCGSSACATELRREPRRRRRLAAAVLVGEHRHERGERRRVEVVEQPLPQALDHQQVALVEQSGEASRRRRSATSRRGSPTPRGSAAPGRSGGPSDWLRPLTRRLQVVDLARRPARPGPRPAAARRGRGRRSTGWSPRRRRPPARRPRPAAAR